MNEAGLPVGIVLQKIPGMAIARVFQHILLVIPPYGY